MPTVNPLPATRARLYLQCTTMSVPLEKQMWGDEFGACVDRFGIPWMVNTGQPQG